MLYPVKLPPEKPDCCAVCPLLGLIPKEKVPPKSYETLVCIGTREAITKRASEIRASKRDKKHPLHRFCDSKWDLWMELKNRCLMVNREFYLLCRIPYEQKLQFSLNFIKFHRSSKKGGETESE